MKYRKTPATALPALVLILMLNACTSAPEKPLTMTSLPACGWLPNCVNTGNNHTGDTVKPLAANEGEWQALKRWFASQPDWKFVSEDGNFMQLTVTTPTVGFTDDVQLLFIPEKQLIQVRSSSRLGISDLGTNARRVEALRKQMADLD
jgi:uncharacterized protein (DUF1499 family)